MSTYYPLEDKYSFRSPFYVEFNRGDRLNEFTLFKRQFMHSEEEWNKILEKYPKEGIFMSNEVHPWNIFTANYGPDGTVPDRTWVEFMVDALNEKVSKLS